VLTLYVHIEVRALAWSEGGMGKISGCLADTEPSGTYCEERRIGGSVSTGTSVLERDGCTACCRGCVGSCPWPWAA